MLNDESMAFTWHGYRSPKTQNLLTCDDTNIEICYFGPFSEAHQAEIWRGGFHMVKIWFACGDNCRRSYAHKIKKSVSDRILSPVGTGIMI